jgi:hypothetical protein
MEMEVVRVAGDGVEGAWSALLLGARAFEGWSQYRAFQAMCGILQIGSTRSAHRFPETGATEVKKEEG